MTVRILPILVVVVIVVGMIGLFAVNADKSRRYMDRAEEWCQAEGGELYGAMVVGASGGLHCDGIGHHVHMQDVAALDWTHDMAAIQARYDARTGPFGMWATDTYWLVGGAGLLAVFITMGTQIWHRRGDDV